MATGILKRAIEEVYDRKPMIERPISATVGRLSSPLTALMLGTDAPLKPSASKNSRELQTVIEEADGDEDTKDTAVMFGSTRPIEQLKRMYRNRRISPMSKALGTAIVPLQAGMASLFRSDYYDPFSDTAVVFDDEPSILAHELGHAKDFNRTGYPGAYSFARAIPLLTLYQEYQASKNGTKTNMKAIKKLHGDSAEAFKALRRHNRVLGGGFGSYVGGGMLGRPVLGALAGSALGHLSPEGLFVDNDIRDEYDEYRNKTRKKYLEEKDDKKKRKASKSGKKHKKTEKKASSLLYASMMRSMDEMAKRAGMLDALHEWKEERAEAKKEKQKRKAELDRRRKEALARMAAAFREYQEIA